MRYIVRIILAPLALLSSSGLPTNALAMDPSTAATVGRNVVAGTAIFTAGDAAAQLLTSDDNTIDRNRLSSSAGIGAVWSGLCVPAVYSAVEGLVPGRSVGRILVKMLISCSVLSTAGNYVTMFARRWIQTLRRAEGGPSSFGECVRSCNGDIFEVIADDLKVWPLYDISCFAFVPPQMRPITTAIMSSLWAMYMSIVSARVSSGCAPVAVAS